mgnify:CR=1 FL=1
MAYYDYEYLKNQGFGVGWLDISDRIKDTTALALSKNITEYWVQEIANYGLTTTCMSNPDELLAWADSVGLNYIMVVATGSNLSKKQNLLNEIPDFLISHPDLTVAGHLLDKGEKFYEKLHQHKEIQISVVLKGEGTYIIGDCVGDFKPNDIFS